MKPASYWNKRMEILEQSRYDGNVQSYHEIENIYRKQMAEMQKEINAWYARFANNNEINLADARKLLDAKELEELKWNVEDYIKYGTENALDPKWIKQLENASARYHISRLEALQLQIQQRAESVMAAEQDVVDERVREVYSENYYHTAFEIQRGIGIGWDLERLDERRIDNVISKPWAVDGKNFSERIWEQRDKLVNTLHQELTQSIIRGEDPERAVKTLAERMSVSQSNARRLIMTESAAMASAAQKECYKELDVEQYKIVATLDDLTCDVCAGLDGQVFKMSEYNVGTTAPPFHPNCRTVTVPYFADDADSKRAARGADGKTYLVPADTKYNEWKKAFVDGEEKPFEVDPDWKPKEPEPQPEPIELKYKFVEAKTIEEAQEFAKQFIGDGYAPHFKNDVNFKGISIEHANEINRALTDAFNRFDLPKLNGIITVSPTSAIGKKAFKDGADAVFSYSPAEGGIYINKDVVKNAKSFETYVKRSEDAWNTVINNIDKLKGADKEKALIYQKAGRDLVDGKSIKGLFTHEIGHHVQWQLLKPKEINDIGSRKSQFAPNISGYANATQGEYFAESFAAYMKGERTKLDPEFVKLLDSKQILPNVQNQQAQPKPMQFTNINGVPIVFDKSMDQPNRLESKRILEELCGEYDTRLTMVRVAKPEDKIDADGDVDFSGLMRLRSTRGAVAIHEFAHSFTISHYAKKGMYDEKTEAFWKEMQKTFRDYKKDYRFDHKVSISFYSHDDVDEFMAEAFTVYKSNQLGVQLPNEYNVNESSMKYVNRVGAIIDKYFKKPKGKLESTSNNQEPIKISKRKPVPEKASDVREKLIKDGVQVKSYKELENVLTSEEIVDKIAGGDMTKGSCSSAAFAYVGNKMGFDVRDFRGGKSREVFATNGNISKIAQLDGVTSYTEKDTNDFKAIRRLLQNVKDDKEYYLAIGGHAAIVRKIYDDSLNFHYEYLELQSRKPEENKFKRLSDDILKRRFKCQKSYTTIGIKLEMTSTLIDIESLGENAEFQALLEYINTNDEDQMKGVLGDVK
ncbi:MAG: minor capsid protein [Alphaproteobacteria bacterium]|nr:minor capsid protein [Alphaproteobacteria bacterium]